MELTENNNEYIIFISGKCILLLYSPLNSSLQCTLDKYYYYHAV